MTWKSGVQAASAERTNFSSWWVFYRAEPELRTHKYTPGGIFFQRGGGNSRPSGGSV